jgi:hypothetical protein
MKAELRLLILSAKIMQFFADIFAVAGIAFFAYLYFQNYQNNPMAALKDPFFIATVILPFVPAAVLAALAASKRKKIKALLEQGRK